MKIAKDELKDELERKGSVTKTIRGRTIKIVKRKSVFEVTVDDGDSPDSWAYRNGNIALDRFCELLDSIRRGK